jgi:hypothetical protein
MTPHRRRLGSRVVLAGVVVMVLSGSSAAEAQNVPALEEGTRVWITTADGREHEGSVASMSSTELVLRIDAAARPIALADVRRVEGRDSLGNGLRNGGLIGAAALGGFGLFLSHALCESSEGCLRNDLGPLVRIAALGAGVGMASGALIDYAIKGRRLLYSSPNSPIVFQVIPQLTAGSVGARVSVTWFH